MHKLHAVIMAGGSGTRFWPASRKDRPKQFLPLVGGKSLISSTLQRVSSLVGPEHTWIVTNERLARALPELLPDLPSSQVIVEPVARDTAPCAALATAWIDAHDPGATVALMPADHVIEPVATFQNLLRRAAEIAAERSALVTLGVRPTRPSTAYGYIERGEPIDDREPQAFRVAEFREKPDLETARRYLESGRCWWNSGIFVWTHESLLRAMEAGDGELATATRAARAAASGADRSALERAFGQMPATSIDYAVMENAPDVVVIPADLTWTDVGSFVTLDAVSPRDSDDNVRSLHDGARSVLHETRRCVTYAEGARTVALFGVSDLTVVAVDDAVLVCPTERADDLKALIERVRSEGLEELL